MADRLAPGWVHVGAPIRCDVCRRAAREGFQLFTTPTRWTLCLCMGCAEAALDGDDELVAALIRGQKSAVR